MGVEERGQRPTQAAYTRADANTIRPSPHHLRLHALVRSTWSPATPHCCNTDNSCITTTSTGSQPPPPPPTSTIAGSGQGCPDPPPARPEIPAPQEHRRGREEEEAMPTGLDGTGEERRSRGRLGPDAAGQGGGAPPRQPPECRGKIHPAATYTARPLADNAPDNDEGG
ncbi:hypothetical protein ZWY2020_021932 [Hordeum vulgare]|nr:hypothetical protein ZWY2020_021932 [Hordeum vulgare]